MQEYYNVIPFNIANAVPRTIARVVNNLVNALNEHDRLPKFILVMLDKDLLMDLDVFLPTVIADMKQTTNWLVRQIDMIIRRKKAELLDKKPGAVYTGDPRVIFV